MPDLSPQSNLVASVVESTVNIASSPVASSSMPAPSESGLGNNALVMNYRNASGSMSISKELPSSSVSINPSLEFVGDPVRNVKVLGNYLMKARQKTKPKYAARYLVRVLFPKETLLCSIMGVSARGRRTLDPNKIAAIREFLATNFPNYDLREHGKDWKTCITNVNAMIRCLRSETKINPETAEGKEKAAVAPDTSHCVDLNYNEDSEGNSQNSQKMTSSGSDTLQNSGLDKFAEAFHAPSVKKPQSLEPMELLGSPWRNVQLPFSVIYVAKGKSRPELSARYLIRHMFTEDVLVKSNVYGNLERGMSPLDCNRINALRDFLQENYPSFDLKETGYDWKACVAAINSTIRSLRHDHKKATVGIRRKVLAVPPLRAKSPPQSPTLAKLCRCRCSWQPGAATGPADGDVEAAPAEPQKPCNMEELYKDTPNLPMDVTSSPSAMANNKLENGVAQLITAEAWNINSADLMKKALSPLAGRAGCEPKAGNNIEIVSTSQTAKVIVSVKDAVPTIFCGKIKGLSGVSTKNFSFKRDLPQDSVLQCYDVKSPPEPRDSAEALRKPVKNRSVKLKKMNSPEIHILPIKKQRLAAFFPRK
ncbi:PREDICTED: BEN domain-containing protein 2-like [Charadrius vociferus]|uniref:BEN domain-containing protein 2-like n=1 Tax=Charadrius vociferus TaxID=50402 RepID=UPI000521264A|nr:PREDICTED: BEN domain-containing protein 2-like [Charadrius vociferus]